MASFSEDLTCPVCLTVFTDPVILFCGHTFCRECITLSLTSQHQCPQCRAPVPLEGERFLTNHVLKSLAEKAKEAEKLKKERGSDKEVAELCPEHEEKLKLFCITDQQLACIICRDGEKHEGHKFKPIKEAAASVRKQLETFVQHVSDDIQAIEGRGNTQKEEITKTLEKSQQLMTQISSQFEEMHQFLRKREEDIKSELKNKEEDAVEKMSETLKVMETALSEIRELEAKVTSVLTITDSETLLKSWTEDKDMRSTTCSFKSRGGTFQVENTSLSLGPYESHLQFFVWKEMLQVIQPQAERLSVQRKGKYMAVSDDGRSLFFATQNNATQTNSQIQPRVERPVHRLSKFLKTPDDGSDLFSATQNNPTQTKSQIQPRAERLSVQRKGEYMAVSDDGRSLFSATQNSQYHSYDSYGSYDSYCSYCGGSDRVNRQFTSSSSSNRQTNYTGNTSTFSDSAFISGQHYWEVDVGKRNYWELGLQDYFLRYNGQSYEVCGQNTSTLQLKATPRKIGLYITCSSQELSFYDADTMTHIHTLSCCVSVPASAYFNIQYTASDCNPVTVCWY